MFERSCVLILLFVIFDTGIVAQIPHGEGSRSLATHLDVKSWKSFQLNDFTTQLPNGFEHTGRKCIHFPCGTFKLGETHLVLSKGDLPYPSSALRSKPDFEEVLLTVGGLTTLVFQYSDENEITYVATFPSDQIGYAMLTLKFRSKDMALSDFARLVLKTVVFKTQLKGPQRFYVHKECPPAAPLEKKPMGFDELKGRLGRSNAKLLAREIESRRIEFELTTGRESELVKVGVDRQVLLAIRKVAIEIDEQTKVYDRFVANYASQLQSSRTRFWLAKNF